MKRRVILLAPLLALFPLVATTEERAEAADVAARVEGENFEVKPTGTLVVTDSSFYSPPNAQALKFTSNTAIARHTVTFANQGDVVLWARGGQSGGSPTLMVRVGGVNGGAFSAAQPITSSGAPVAYTFDLNVPAGTRTIEVQAGNVATGRNIFLDFVSFPASGTVGPSLDTDNDGVIDAQDQCDTQPGPAPTGCPTDPGGGAAWNCTGTANKTG